MVACFGPAWGLADHGAGESLGTEGSLVGRPDGPPARCQPCLAKTGVPMAVTVQHRHRLSGRCQRHCGDERTSRMRLLSPYPSFPAGPSALPPSPTSFAG